MLGARASSPAGDIKGICSVTAGEDARAPSIWRSLKFDQATEDLVLRRELGAVAFHL
jgi:hypothetical protein